MRVAISTTVRWLLVGGLSISSLAKFGDCVELVRSGRGTYLGAAAVEIALAVLIAIRWRPVMILWCACACVMAAVIWNMVASDTQCACFGTLWSPSVSTRLVVLGIAGIFVVWLLAEEAGMGDAEGVRRVSSESG